MTTHSPSATAHLLVGLGGLGCRLVRRVSHMLARRTPRGHHPPLRCVGIDTDREVAGDEEGYESIYLSLDAAARVLAPGSEHPFLKEWLPPGLTPSAVEPGHGVRGSRPLARLSLLLFYREVERQLAATLARIGGADPAFPVERRPERLRVYLVSSAGGGTGSGIFCDVAYLVHRLMSEVPIPYSCQGLILTGLNPAADEHCLANLYGSLTELNHWMAPDTTYRISLPPREVWESSRPPFEQVYLFPVVEPGDVPGTEAVFAQISAHLALHMAEQYSALEAEVARRHAAFAATDGRGNPVSYFSSGTAALSLPLAELAQAIAARLGSQVIGRWRNTLFRSDDASHPENEPQAHRFLLAQSLSPGSVKRALEESVLVAEGGRFDVRGRIARLRHELQQHPSYAAELGRRLMDCDRELTQAIGPEGGGLAAWLGRTSSELLRQRSQALLEEVSSFFAPGRETYLGFCVFLEQISDVISRHLNELYELLNQRESDDLRLLDEKKASLAEAAQYNPGPLSRLLRRQADGPVTRCLDLLEKYHENRVEIYLTRETLNLYLGLMDSLQRFSSGINELLEYLDGVGADLAEEERRAVERIFAVPGEVLLSRPEVERLLERRCGGAAVEQATEHLLAALGRELFSLPRTHPRPALVGEILSVLARQMVDMSGTDVFSAFIARYPGEAASDQLRLLFERARPAFLPSTAIPDYDPAAEPRAVYVALPGGSEPESVPKARLLEALDRLPGEAPLNVVPLLDREKVVFLRLAGGFPLGALDLEKAHRAYLQQLRFGPPRMHSRADVRWHALVRPSPRERQRVREILAVGLQLGLVLPGNEPGAPLVTPRWADPGTLFRCLELYPDMIEAFSVESHFLTALRRWQDEKVDEVGSEAYVRLLSEPRGELSLLGQSFEGDLARARAAFETQREERWPQWDRAIARALAQNPWLPANDLVSVPAGFRKWAMLRYIEAHPDEHLTYHAASARLELVSARELEIFRQQWRRVLEAGDENPEAWAEACRDLVRFLCHALGFTPGEALESGTFSGLRVTAHGMRVRLPSKIPFMVSRLGALTPDQAQVLRSLLESLGLDSRFALLLTPGRKEQAVQVLDQQLRAALRYDVIVLTPEDIRDILKVRDRSRALVAKILEQVDLTVVSPFVTEGPVPASMFFGREGEIKEILYRLDQASLALIGPRRIGKTSVLQRCLAALQSQNRPVLYIDCQAVYDYKGFLDLVAAEHLSGRSYGPWESPLGFRALLADLASLHAGGRLLFILDEVDLLLREDREGSEGLFRVFRSVSQGGLATFLFCGEKTLLARMKDPNSALHNFCHHLRLHFLEPRDAARLVSEPMEQMEIRWEDREASLERIIEVTSAHPNLLQRACAQIVGRLNREGTRRITREQVEEVIADPEFLEEYLDTLWGRSGELEKILSLALEEGEELSAQEMRRRLESDYGVEVSLPAVVEGMESLCLFGLLEKRGSRYAFAARSFPWMVRQVMDIAEEIELHKEMMEHGG